MFQVSEPFWMHDATRRRVCLGLFILGCVVPTLGLFLWAGWRMSPLYVRQQAAQLERILGLPIRLEGVHHLRPGQAVYEGIQLLDPETGKAIFRADRGKARWAEPNAPSRACVGMLELVFEGLEVDAQGMVPLAELLRRALKQPPHWPRYEIRIQANELRFRAGQQTRNLAELTGFLQPLEDGSHGRLSFRLSGQEGSEPIMVRFGRDHSQSPPVSGLELAIPQSAVPCSLLARLFPALERLGTIASARGTLWVHQYGSRVEYRFQGQLLHVDLKTLLGEDLGPMLSGLAQIEVQDCRIVGSRLEEAQGSITAGPGTISRHLWESALEQLHLSTSLTSAPAAQSFPYEQLAVAFRIGPDGLWLRGICPVPAPGSILVDSHRQLLGEPQAAGSAIPIAALVRTLVPPDSICVPATRQAERLLRLLPIPSAKEGLPTQPATSSASLETASRTSVP